MSDWRSFALSTASDPLVGGFVVIAVGALVSRLLFGRHPTWRALARVVFLVILTVLLLRGGIVPYQPLQSSGMPLRDAIVVTLKVAWWLWAAWFLVALIERAVVIEQRPREGKLVRDLLSAVIYLAAVFAIIAYVFNLPVQGLLATSGAIAIILGLALQSTLNDVFSGLVLNFSRPFRPGDSVSIEGSTEGQVVEMNWRATHILTGRHDLAILPNSTIAKSKIVNLSSPSSIHGIVLTVRLACPPAAGMAIVQTTLLNARSVLAVPQPAIRILSINEAQTEYEAAAFVDGVGSASRAQNEFFDLVYRHAAASGIRLAPSKDQLVQTLGNADAKTTLSGSERVLAMVPIFAALTPEERGVMATKLKRASYMKGDVVLEPGIISQSLFLVGRGVLSVAAGNSGMETEVLRFGPGDHYGEIGLLTGAANSATITAIAPSTVYEIAKADLTPVLEARPQVARELSQALAQRQAAGQALAAPELDRIEPHAGLANWFLGRIHRLLEQDVSG